MTAVGPFVERVGDFLLQYGIAPKTAASQSVAFATPFGAPPNVVISPFWDGQNAEVGHAETLERVAADRFELISNNAAGNYFVCWVALGRAPDAARPELVLRHGDLIMTGGRQVKMAQTSYVVSHGLDLQLPTVQVSPHWDGAGRGVGHAETVNAVNGDEFSGASGNAAPTYGVQYLVAGARAGSRPADARVAAFDVGDSILRIGRYDRPNKGTHNYAISGAAASDPHPVVVVSPHWLTPSRGVGHAETLSEIGGHFFSTSSGNAASNYFVSWLSITRR